VAFYKDGNSNADSFVVGRNGEGDDTSPLPTDLNQSKDLKLLKSLSKKGSTGAYIEIHGKEYETLAIKMAEFAEFLIIIGTDWKVIPLENLIAELHNKDILIIAGAIDAEDAKVALETMELGAHGVLLNNNNEEEIKKTINLTKEILPSIEIKEGIISKITPVGKGLRACIDTCELLELNDGLLVGSQSNGFFLVAAEVEESPFISPRPFRVNAGCISCYVLIGDKTKYLEELEAGSNVMVVNTEGSARQVLVGRSKVERRPLIVIEAEVEGKTIKVVLQNAETIRLFDESKKTISVSKLKVGDKVQIHLGEGARHFGIEIDETIIEK
jgi:3-dehydroquinate synthase II